MRLTMIYVFSLSVLVATLVIGVPATLGEAVDGTWVNAVNQGDGPIWNPDTNNPIVGEEPNDPDFDSNFADAEMIHSPFSLITLTNPGDKVVFTGSVELDGTRNSPSNAGAPRTQYRFGLFKDDGNGDDLGWVGYYMSNKHGDVGGTPLGSLARKPVGNTSVYLSVTGHNILASVGGDGTAASLFNDDVYSMNMTIERNAAGELLVSATLTGVNGFSQMLNATDTTASTLGTYQFDRLGFLMGSNLDTDRAAYMDLEVTFIPGDVSLVGDYNEDGTVDAADYVVWRKDPASHGGDPQGYEDWRANFGMGPGAGSGLGAAGAVPEPASMVLVAFAVALLISLYRRRPVAVRVPVRN